MKTFLQKLFNQDEQTRNGHHQEFPPSVSSRCLKEHHRRSLIGWFANRMGQILQLECWKTGALIYESLIKEQIDNPEKEEEYLLFLAYCLVDWLEKERDVYLCIKETSLSDKHHRCLLQLYEEIKDDIYSYFPRNNTKVVEHHEDDAIWQVYRDVIYAATQKKFLLIREDEIQPFKQGKVICETIIKERSDIPKARDLAKQSLLDHKIPLSAVMSYLLLISEGITNILKHANEGKLTIIDSEPSLHVLIEDSGPGFPLKILPYTTLMAGYSTKKSLGQGFTLMMKMSDQVFLSTSSKGSTIILVFQGKEGTKLEGIV